MSVCNYIDSLYTQILNNKMGLEFDHTCLEKFIDCKLINQVINPSPPLKSKECSIELVKQQHCNLLLTPL